MYMKLAFTTFVATVLAQAAAPDATWQPAIGTSAQCSQKVDEILSPLAGPQVVLGIQNACAEMMPPCAFPDRLPKGTFCTQTTDFLLDGPKKSIQGASIETSQGIRIVGLDLQFTVVPAVQPVNPAGVFWSVADCYGYFAALIGKTKPLGCLFDRGYGIGNITVGSSNFLQGTVFGVAAV